MTLETWAYYLLTMLLLTSTPGPSVLFSVSNSLNGGVKKAFFGALGGTTAITIKRLTVHKRHEKTRKVLAFFLPKFTLRKAK